MAQNGSPAGPCRRRDEQRPTSVAVSKPRPNRTPTGYICHESSMERVPSAPKKRLMSPRALSSPRARLGRTRRAHLAEHPQDPEQDHELSTAIITGSSPDTIDADDAADRSEAELAVARPGLERLRMPTVAAPERSPRWSAPARRRSRRPADARPGHELARRVVDRRDVVRIEGVAQAQRPRGHATPMPTPRPS